VEAPVRKQPAATRIMSPLQEKIPQSQKTPQWRQLSQERVLASVHPESASRRRRKSAPRATSDREDTEVTYY